MNHVNFEFKARLRNEKRVRAILKKMRARYLGRDHQLDIYFRVPSGRLKIRAGRIENALIFYQRSNSARTRSAPLTTTRSPAPIEPLTRSSVVRPSVSNVT